MKKLMILKSLAICLGLFFAFGMVSAQKATGNNGPAQRLNDKAKQEMVKKNAPDNVKIEHYAQKSGYLMLPGFTFTGDKAVDEQNYRAAKIQYIQNNPNEYRKALVKDPNKRSGAQTVTAVANNGLTN
jgi:hypothetical protein